MEPAEQRVLYVIACGAPPARNVHVLVELAQEAGWDVCVIATPSAVPWLDLPELVERTGHPVRSAYQQPGEPTFLPEPDALVVAPATFNTINKWAAGISDTLALGLICEGIGRGLPIVVLPFLNAAQARHPAFTDSVDRLRAAGVTVLFGPDVLELHQPRQGMAVVASFPWHLALKDLPPVQPARS